MKILVCGGRNVGRVSPSPSHALREAVGRASAERVFVGALLDALHAEKRFCEIIIGDESELEQFLSPGPNKKTSRSICASAKEKLRKRWRSATSARSTPARRS